MIQFQWAFVVLLAVMDCAAMEMAGEVLAGSTKWSQPSWLYRIQGFVCIGAAIIFAPGLK